MAKRWVFSNKERATFYGAGLTILLGLLVIVMGLVLSIYVPHDLRKDVKSDIVVDSTEDENYADWTSNYDDTDPARVRKYYVFDLTNPVEVADGTARAKYNEIGPFTYRIKQLKSDVSFSADEEEASYTLFQQQEFIAEESVGNPRDVMITTPNLGRQLLLHTYDHDEQTLSLRMTSHFLGDWVNEFAAEVEVLWVSTRLKEYRATRVLAPPAGVGSLQNFYTQWSTGTLVAATPLDLSFNGNARLPADVVPRLFDDLSDVALTSGVGVSRWWAALSDEHVSTSLQDELGLTASQMNSVKSFLFRVKDDSEAELKARFSVTSLTDLAYLQWGARTVFPDGVAALLDQPYAPEYNAHDGAGELTLEQVRSLMTRFAEPEQLELFLGLTSSAANMPFVSSYFSMSENDAQQLASYLEAVQTTIVLDQLELFRTQSVHETLFGVDATASSRALDPATAALAPLFYSFNNAQEAAQAGWTYTAHTGSDDVNEVGELVEFRGQTAIAIYDPPLAVNGQQDTQVKTEVQRVQTLNLWQDAFLRNEEWTYVRDSEIKQIETFEYAMGSQFAPACSDATPRNCAFGQSYDGVHDIGGSVGRPFPFYVSKPFFFQADPLDTTYRFAPGSMNTDASRDESTLHVHPFTGEVLQVNQRYQYNVYVQGSNRFYPNTEPNFAPIVRVDESQLVTDDRADYLEDEVDRDRDLARVLRVVVPIVGVLVMLAGGSVWVHYKKRYDEVRDHKALGAEEA